MSQPLLTPQLVDGLANWIRILQVNRSGSYSIVAYRSAVEAAPPNPAECKKMGRAAKAKAQHVVVVLRAMAPDLGATRIEARQQVCSPPSPELMKGGSADSAFILLQLGEVPDCDCERTGESP